MSAFLAAVGVYTTTTTTSPMTDTARPAVPKKSKAQQSVINDNKTDKTAVRKRRGSQCTELPNSKTTDQNKKMSTPSNSLLPTSDIATIATESLTATDDTKMPATSSQIPPIIATHQAPLPSTPIPPTNAIKPAPLPSIPAIPTFSVATAPTNVETPVTPPTPVTPSKKNH